MAMTARVITNAKPASEKIAMTSPVITKGSSMSFVLPFSFKSLSDIPEPTDSRITITEVPGKTVAVSKFSGWYSDNVGKRYLTELCTKLKNQKLINNEDNEDSIDWCVAQYHPPFTIPFLRRNEIWVKLDPTKVSSISHIS